MNIIESVANVLNYPNTMYKGISAIRFSCVFFRTLDAADDYLKKE